ncbi:MAG: hypothetical protein Q8Q09_29700 [Deltaproteobacteria bacterium]|nr:hypothetical protein [Deltaproteobacteria bacterium]
MAQVQRAVHVARLHIASENSPRGAQEPRHFTLAVFSLSVALCMVEPACAGSLQTTTLVSRSEAPSASPSAPQTGPNDSPAPPRASPEFASLPESLRTRMDQVLRAFSLQGARVVDAPRGFFLAPEGSAVLPVQIQRGQCFALVALGSEGIRRLELRVHDAVGINLGQDAADHNHPYVRLCTREGAQLNVVLRASEGAGTVALALLAQPPTATPDLAVILGDGGSQSLAGPRTPRANIGFDPAIESEEDLLSRHRARMLLRGYTTQAAPTLASLQPLAHRDFVLPLESGRCYGLLVVPEPDSTSVSVELLDPEGRVVTNARDLARDPLVRGCLAQGGAYVLRIASRDESRFAMQWFSLDDRHQLSSNIAGELRAGSLELMGEASRRGMRALRVAHRVVSSGAPLVLPVSLRAGSCSLFGAVSSGTGLQLSLTDGHGGVVASDTAGSSSAKVWYCTTLSREMALTVRPTTARGEYVVVHVEDGT